MQKEKGISYCGLACCLCNENKNCPGCKNNGCKDWELCYNLICCRKKGLDGCWECDRFPCAESRVQSIRVKAFAGFIRKYGKESLLERLEQNELDGLVYHHPGSLIGDYDQGETEEEIIRMLLKGRE